MTTKIPESPRAHSRGTTRGNTHTHPHTYTHAHPHTHTRAHTYNVYIHPHTYIPTRAHTCTQICIHIYTPAHIQQPPPHVHTDMYNTHVQTRVHPPPQHLLALVCSSRVSSQVWQVRLSSPKTRPTNLCLRTGSVEASAQSSASWGGFPGTKSQGSLR